MKKDASMSLPKSFLLFLIAFVLLVSTAPIGFLYALLRNLFFGGIKKLNIFFLDAAIAIDNTDRKSTRLNSSHIPLSRMPSSA